MAFEKRVEPSHSPAELDIQEAKLVMDGRVKGKQDLAHQAPGSHSAGSQGPAGSPPTEAPGGPSPAVDVDFVISMLKLPECGAEVSRIHSNEHTADKQVQAYAKLAGRNWTYYVQQLEIIIGRSAADSTDRVDIDLAPSKIVSRRHAVIRYNLSTRHWEVVSFGRNGLRLDGTAIRAGNTVTLSSGNVLDIGNVQMMFVLPDAEPVVAPIYVQRVRAEQRSRLESQSKPSDKPLVRSNSSGAGSSHGSMGEPSVAYPRGVTIVSRPQVPSSQYLVQDLASDDCKDIKPPFSYATMISQAILSTSEHMMTLADIYTWISSHYAFYRFSKPGWQNSIRHNLSLNKAFEKVARKENEPGKGSKWHIVDLYKDDLIKKATTGRQAEGGSYIPRRPYEDSPPPLAGRKRSHTEATLVQTKEEGGSRPSPVQPHAQPDRTQPPQQAQPPQQQQQQPQSQQQHPQSQQQQQQFQMQMQYMQQQFQVPPGQQQSYQLPVPVQNMGGNSFPMQSFQYMTPYGMPYYPPQPGQPMVPMVHMPAQQVSGQQSNRQDQTSSPELTQETGVHEARQDSEVKRQSDEGRDSFEPKGLQGDPSSRDSSEVKVKEDDAGQEKDSTTSSENGALQEDAKPLELQTPARPAKRGLHDSGETPVLGSAVKLPPDQVGGVPESSPALWKYMNLESTPNNMTPATSKAGRETTHASGRNDSYGATSSPPRSASASRSSLPEPEAGPEASRVNEPVPLMEKLEEGKAV